MLFIVRNILLIDICRKEAGKVLSLDEGFSFFLGRRADADRFYIRIIQIEPCRDIVDLVYDHDNNVFQCPAFGTHIFPFKGSQK